MRIYFVGSWYARMLDTCPKSSPYTHSSRFLTEMTGVGAWMPITSLTSLITVTCRAVPTVPQKKVCMESICTGHATLQYDCHPQEMCHGNGVCNNFKHCHCDAGFSPPDCSSGGNGGSVDSGPVGKPADRNLSLFGVGESPDSRMEDEEINLKVVVLVVPIFLIVLLCCLMLIAYLWSEVQEAVSPGSSSTTSSSESESD